MKIGYARTLTIDQNLDLQLDVLKTAVVSKPPTIPSTGLLDEAR